MFQHFAEIMEPVLENEPRTVEVKVRAGMSRISETRATDQQKG